MDGIPAAPTRCGQRAVIKFFYAERLAPFDSHRKLKQVFGQNCMDVKNVRKWCRQFASGRENVHHKEGSGRPSLEDSKIQQAQAIVNEDRRVILKELRERVHGVSQTTMYRIMRQPLRYGVTLVLLN